jgi:uncharacterized membrane protein
VENLEMEEKRKFQLERLILFSDAVFAIAITLLIIEIKVPHLEHNITDEVVLKEILHLLPKFVGFIFSFFIIGIYWTVHHNLFGYLKDYDAKLLWLNLLFLFSIVLMPFTTAFYNELYQGHLRIPYMVYTLNICLCGFTNFLLVRHLKNSKNNIASGFDDENMIKASYAKCFMMPSIFLLGVIISYIFPPWLGRFAPMLMPIYLLVVNKLYPTKSE